MIGAMTEEKQLLIMWIVYSVVALAGVAAFFVWAVRSGQFSQQDRARGLALKSGIPEETGRESGEEEKKNEY
jgi:cbb3-type cytochrome oxidase maturation protein